MKDTFGDASDRRRGALVVSLDFELAWGVHDSLGSHGAYRANLLGAREAVPRMLDLFAEYGIAATWATVGMLFAATRDELEGFRPAPLPTYEDPRRDPYRVEVGRDEKADPLHFAPSLIEQIAATPRQEIGSHTFSHYYCLDPGQTVQQFEADLNAAVAIAAARGFGLESLVLPKHQVRFDYLPAIARAGFVAHRGSEAHVLARPRASGRDALWTRAARLADSYVSLTGANLVPWASTAPNVYGLVDVRESRFLRPASTRFATLEPVRVARIAAAMRVAADTGSIVHLWWHPHNFGVNLDANLANLRSLLESFVRLRDEQSFASYAMADVAAIASARRSSAEAESPVIVR